MVTQSSISLDITVEQVSLFSGEERSLMGLWVVSGCFKSSLPELSGPVLGDWGRLRFLKEAVGLIWRFLPKDTILWEGTRNGGVAVLLIQLHLITWEVHFSGRLRVGLAGFGSSLAKDLAVLAFVVRSEFLEIQAFACFGFLLISPQLGSQSQFFRSFDTFRI